MVPDFPHAFECCWNNCEQIFNNSQLYFNHVETHVSNSQSGNKLEEIPCQWRGEI
jgi:hypothetical protein